MGQKDVYGPTIIEMLKRAGEGGLTSNEIIQSIRSTKPEPSSPHQLDRMDTGWGIRAALNRLYRGGMIAKMFEVEKDASGRPVDRPPRVEINQFGQERTVRVGPMRRYRFYARGFEPNLVNAQLEPLPAKVAKSGPVTALTKEQIAQLQAEGKLPNDVQGRSK